MVPITPSLRLSEKNIYPAERRRKAKFRFGPVTSPNLSPQLSREKKKRIWGTWEHLARSTSPAELRAHQVRQNANKTRRMLPATAGLQHKEAKGQKRNQRKSKMMEFALFCSWPQWWTLTSQEKNGETTWHLQLTALLTGTHRSIRVGILMYREKNLFSCKKILVTVILGF